jgi:hypothetical protein
MDKKLDCNCGRKPGEHTALMCGVPIPPPHDPKPKTRYRIVGDYSGHNYYIPAERSEDWNKFTQIPENDERSWDVPDWAVRIDGRFTFTDPRCE